MKLPDLVHVNDIQSHLLYAGVPPERAMKIASEVGTLHQGSRYRIEGSDGDAYLYALGAGYFRTADE